MTAVQPPAPAELPAAGAGPLTLGSLCTGYGGLDLAVAQVLDVATAWVADPDPGAAQILAHHWPGVPNLGDITAVDWTTVAPVDVVCGGYPCQPFSYAGHRKGIDDDRHIWPYIAQAVRVLRPRLVFLENVAGHLSLGFGRVLGDLAEAGYDAEWTCLRASDVGGAHRRERVFVLAFAQDADRATRGQWRVAASGQAEGGRAWADARGRGRAPAADPDDERGPGDGTARRAAQRHPESPGNAAAGRWGDYLPAIRRWERVTGRAAPNPREPAPRGGERLSPAFVEWLMGLDEGHVTGVPGLTRNAQLKALGNGVVPQQGAAALAHLIARIELEAT